MNSLDDWRKAYPDAARALQSVVNESLVSRPHDEQAGSEARAQQELRLAAARAGVTTWRNNNGAFKDENGRQVRYGLGNDSKKLNSVIKMGDVVGAKPVLITPDMVGQTVAVFWMREVKKPGWAYSGDPHELAQLNAINLVNRIGGDAAFSTGAL